MIMMVYIQKSLPPNISACSVLCKYLSDPPISEHLSTFYRKKPVEHDVITFYYVFENAEKHPNVLYLLRYIW